MRRPIRGSPNSSMFPFRPADAWARAELSGSSVGVLPRQQDSVVEGDGQTSGDQGSRPGTA
jgi:hypothetical protein